MITIPPDLGSTTCAYSGLREMISLSGQRPLRVARDSIHSERAKRNETDAASSNSPNASAPKAAVTIMQLVSNWHLRMVFQAFNTTGGSPVTTLTMPAYLKYFQEAPKKLNKLNTQKTPLMRTFHFNPRQHFF